MPSRESAGRFRALLERTYAHTPAVGDRLAAHRLLAALVGAPLVTMGLVFVNQVVLLDFPNSGDEHAYLYQARTMAAGLRLGLPAWLVDPLLGPVTLALVWCLGARLYTPRVARLRRRW